MVKKNKVKTIQIKELEERLKRTLADYENLEKRTQREIDEKSQIAAQRLILSVLPVLDNLEKAQEHLKDEGVSMVSKQFRQVLENQGVSEIVLEEQFDPELCEAIEVVEGQDEGKIAQVLEKGYSLAGRVIRTAKVKVIKKDVSEDVQKAQKASEFGDYA